MPEGFEQTSFYSDSDRVAGLLRLADPAARAALPAPAAIVICPGFTGTMALPRFLEFAERLAGRGFDVLIIDYRGWGDSEGRRGAIVPLDQVQDIRNAVTFLDARFDGDSRRVGLLGFSFGGANAAYALAVDERIGAAVVVNAIGDGREWLRRLRTEHDWNDWLDLLAEARRQRILTGTDPLVDPIRQIMVETPTRRDSPERDKAADAARTALSSADAILDFRPIDALQTGRPGALCVVTTARDTTTPEEHSRWLFEAARGPKQFVLLPRGGRYPSYMGFADEVFDAAQAWFREHLGR